MQFDRAEVRAPGERLGIIDQDVIDVPLVMAPRNLVGLDPRRRMLRRILLVETLAFHPVWKTNQCYRPVLEVRKNVRRDLEIVANHLSFGEPAREVHLPGVRKRDRTLGSVGSAWHKKKDRDGGTAFTLCCRTLRERRSRCTPR